jgi:hypothetical protein
VGEVIPFKPLKETPQGGASVGLASLLCANGMRTDRADALAQQVFKKMEGIFIDFEVSYDANCDHQTVVSQVLDQVRGKYLQTTYNEIVSLEISLYAARMRAGEDYP